MIEKNRDSCFSIMQPMSSFYVFVAKVMKKKKPVISLNAKDTHGEYMRRLQLQAPMRVLLPFWRSDEFSVDIVPKELFTFLYTSE